MIETGMEIKGQVTDKIILLCFNKLLKICSIRSLIGGKGLDLPMKSKEEINVSS
jgi:hypothetical protein